MISALTSPKALSYFEILPENLQNASAQRENLPQKSEILSLHLINSERFADLNPFSLRNFAFVCESQEKSEFRGAQERECEVTLLEDPLYNVLSLKRGKSECYMGQQEPFGNVHQYFVEEPTALIDIDIMQDRQVDFQYFSSGIDIPMLHEHDDSEGDSKNLLSSSNDGEIGLKKSDSTQAKVSTKNVTKNMGKLLFKYIWKNRMTLRKNFDVSNAEWDSFLSQIRIWKKENNITRQFLNIRWHSQGTNCKLFRKISHNFFRKRCLSAILQSKIQCKEMHMRRLRRFQEGTSNASALDSLN